MSLESNKTAIRISLSQEATFRQSLYVLQNSLPRLEASHTASVEALNVAEKNYEGRYFEHGSTDAFGRPKKTQREWRMYYCEQHDSFVARSESLRLKVTEAEALISKTQQQIASARHLNDFEKAVGLEALLGVRQIECESKRSDLARHASYLETSRNSLGQTLLESVTKARAEETEDWESTP
jgi:hypothetical protein